MFPIKDLVGRPGHTVITLVLPKKGDPIKLARNTSPGNIKLCSYGTGGYSFAGPQGPRVVEAETAPSLPISRRYSLAPRAPADRAGAVLKPGE
jgi:hypothetical protein